MLSVNEKIAALRKIMDRENLSAYIISGTDPHNSEYLAPSWQQRKWISGFTGSYGTVVVTMKTVGLWTDSRYFIQAEKELQGTEIKLYKLRTPGAVDYPEWLTRQLKEGEKVGFDGFCMPTSEIKHLEQTLLPFQIKVIEKVDLLGEVWFDRPLLPNTPLFLLDEKTTGQSITEKIKTLHLFLKESNAGYLLLSALDDIAWTLNIRGNDIPYNPLVISYAVIGNEKAWLFVKQTKVDLNTRQVLQKNGVEIIDYHHLMLFLEERKEKDVFVVDSSTLNFAIYNKLKAKCKVIEKSSPIPLQKAIKNATEIAGFKKACLNDGIAVTRFLYWLEHSLSHTELRETDAAMKIGEFRKECPDYVSDSFNTISAYGKNAALPHYSAIPGSDSVIKREGLYLIDSGGQYIYGTTDITRTIPVGKLTDLEKEDYTLVLQGMIALSLCKFPQGCSGGNIDIIARYPLWKKQRNYGHGTGHGIGHFLCVHEGPQSIRQNLKEQPFSAGMVTSNEPGMYREGFHGIRHENMILCKESETNEFGDWLEFETLTLCYFDTSAILTSLLNRDEIEWLNNYHQKVFETLSPYLSKEEKVWLQLKTAKL